MYGSVTVTFWAAEPSFSDRPITQFIHIHALHNEVSFSKFAFREEVEKFRSLPGRAERVSAAVARQRRVISPEMTAKDYAETIAWSAIDAAAAALAF